MIVKNTTMTKSNVSVVTSTRSIARFKKNRRHITLSELFPQSLELIKSTFGFPHSFDVVPIERTLNVTVDQDGAYIRSYTDVAIPRLTGSYQSDARLIERLILGYPSSEYVYIGYRCATEKESQSILFWSEPSLISTKVEVCDE